MEVSSWTVVLSDPRVTVHAFEQSCQESADFDTQQERPEPQETWK